MKYKKPLLQIINAPLEEIEFELSELGSEKRERLLKQYSLTATKTEIIDQSLSNKDRNNNYHLIKKLKRNIEIRNLGIIRTKKNNKLFFKVFEGYTETEVLSILSTLDYKSISLLKRKYGDDFKSETYKDTLTSEEMRYIHEDITRKIKYRLKKLRNGYIIIGIEDLFPNASLEDLKSVIETLNNKEQKVVYSYFETDLKSKALVDKNNINILGEIKNRINRRLRKEPKIKDYKPFIEKFIKLKGENETLEEFKSRFMEVINTLEDHEKELLYKKYGKYLNDTKNNNNLTKEEKYKINILLVVKIKKRLIKMTKEKRKYKLLISYFCPFATLEEVINEIEKLPISERELLQKKYGLNYNETTYFDTLTLEENDRIKEIKTKLLKSILRNKKEEHEIPLIVLKSARELTKTNEYYWLKERVGSNMSLAILMKKYLSEYCTLYQISNLTNTNPYEIITLTKEYLYFMSENFKVNNINGKKNFVYKLNN